MNGLLKKSLAEFMGTAILVFFACGTVIVAGGATAGIITVALAFGLVLIAMVYSIGKISGSHINPAVSLAMLITKRISAIEFTAYIAAQLLGAIAGAAILFSILNGISPAFTGGAFNKIATGSIDGYLDVSNYIASIAIEIILTFVFVYTVLAVTAKKDSKNAGVIIGAALVLVHLIGIPLTGTSVNPARSLGPALMTWVFGGGTTPLSQVWLFFIAPLAGGALAALIYLAFNKNVTKNQNNDPFKEE